MPFCTNCGQQVADGAKFCAGCGAAINTNNNTQRRQEWAGTIIKCPHCGETLPSFTSICPSCNNELRGTLSSESVSGLLAKIQGSTSDSEKIQLIRLFPIPNSKEDILEFMILAVSSFDAEYYASHLDVDDISDAWLAKIEQCYRKAELTLQGTLELQRITNDYLSIKNEIQRKKVKSTVWAYLPYALVIIGLLLSLCDISVGVILFIAGIIMLFTVKGKSNQTIDPQLKGYSSWNNEKKVGWIILNIFSLGIPAIVYSNNKARQDGQYIIQNGEKKKNGFASWSIGAKIGWIILNIYTIGIPAIIYVCVRKNK